MKVACALYGFITGRLVPHMTVIETTLYGDLERLMEKRHSMTPMRREHDDLRRLIASLGELRLRASSRHGGPIGPPGRWRPISRGCTGGSTPYSVTCAIAQLYAMLLQ